MQGQGASATVSGTKWNYLLEWQYRRMREELSKAVTEIRPGTADSAKKLEL